MIVEIEAGEYVPKREFTGWNIEDSTYDGCKLTYQDFFENHLIKNLPCIVQNVSTTWECSEKWIKNGVIDYEYITQTYGEMEAPVADCCQILDYAQRTSNMKISQFMNYMQNDKKSNLLYLKDLHLKKLRPKDNFYTIPKIFTSDWLNEYAHDNNEDDFMFVYIGPKNSWTPLHVDVYCSFSWSVNVTGRKKWILFPPGEEDKLKEKPNQLQLLFDPEKNVDVKHYVIIQEQGDAIFVPSGWYHQVENQLDTISINHNWNNGCNIKFMWDVLNKSLIDVEHEIEQFKDSPDFSSECQILLKALCGANYESFINFISFIAKKRLTQLTGQAHACNTVSLGANHVKFDLKMVHNVMDSISAHPNCKREKKNLLNNSFLLLKQEIVDALKT
ncbi:JmjC domain-containing protein 4 [Operophtera brumata]|uniref:Jumonji domain-containing protein 4 n=1 Tax=Operophtera brumata TaxID=104452 RepID=A0A0L7K318_OPEBR|nr:JmjC domain-containing protein 4 [Operophtera brumata]